ncbi:MAG: NUDIX domain-containing protein [Candidatus Dormibacter sp.]
MPTHRPNEISAGGVVARPSDHGWEVCLVLAGKYWGLPKGHFEPGETAQQAALREISEECGIPVDALSIVGALPPSEYAYRRAGRLTFKLVHHFVVVAPAGTGLVPQPSEIDEAVWLSIELAIQKASFADTRTALSAARAVLDSAVR